MSVCSSQEREADLNRFPHKYSPYCSQQRSSSLRGHTPTWSCLPILSWMRSSALCFVIFFSQSFASQIAEASCLLSYDSAQVLPQGDALARISFQGGRQGLGSALESRLGLIGNRELHLRTGGCEWSSLLGWSLEAGLNQQWMNVNETGLVDLAFRFTASILLADNDEESDSSVGLEPALLVSLPFTLSSSEHSEGAATRQGFVGLSLGMSVNFVDQRTLSTIENGDDVTKQIRLNSDTEWQPLISLSAAVDVISNTPLSLELRWQRSGLYGGAALSYLF